MADLSEKDKRILFGDNYREIEEQNRQKSGVTDRQDRIRKQINFAENSKLSSYALVAIGIGLSISGYFRPGDSDHIITGLIGGSLLVFGAAWRIYISQRIAGLQAANRQESSSAKKLQAV